MTSFRKLTLAVSFSLMGAVTDPAAQAAPEFVNGLALDGAALDRSGCWSATTADSG
ncbi:MAG: hypothetical protein KF722_05085 [Nitrospira sp.]|nr:hypothetical protein [Nitrospira sp.]